MLTGIYDEGATFFGDATQTFARYKSLHVQVLRVNLYWGGKLGVAKYTPVQRRRSARRRLRLVALRPRRPPTRTPTGSSCCSRSPARRAGRTAARAEPAAEELHGTCATSPTPRPPGTAATTPATDGRTLPAVRLWAAWNEPNNPAFLCARSSSRKGGKWVMQSAIDYAKICNAVYSGVHATMFNERAGRLRRHRPAREQQPDELAAVGLADRVPDRGEEGRDEELRRLRAQPVLRRAGRDADDEAARRPGRAARRRRSRSPTSTS